MGSAKRQLEEREDYKNIAYQILIEIQAIKECEYHSDFYYDNGKYEKQTIFAIATSILKEKYHEYKNFPLFHEMVQEVMNESALGASDCPYCEKIAKE